MFQIPKQINLLRPIPNPGMSREVNLLVILCTILTAGHSLGDDTSEPGPYQAGQVEVVVVRADNSTFESFLFYPATAAGENAPYDGSGAPYAAISFGHGYFTQPTKYRSTLEHLATWGYFVMATQSGLELFPDHAEYAVDLSDCLSYLESENMDTASWLYQQVDVEAFGLSGHSMGGGASILAAADDNRIKALANLAAAETDPSAIDAMPSLRVPVSLISGSDDSIVPVESNGQVMYDQGPAPKQLPVLDGAFHCGFLDSNMIFCDNGVMLREEQLSYTRRLLTDFFNLYLKGDDSVWRSVWGPEAFEDEKIDLTRDPGIIVLPPPQLITGVAGGVAAWDSFLTNSGPMTNTYTFFAEENVWPVTFEPTMTAPLAPGASGSFKVTVELPLDSDLSQDEMLMSVRSDLDGGTRASAWLNVVRLARGDLDRDGDVDLSDFDLFTDCATGPGVPIGEECAASDFDLDSDVDLMDWGMFQLEF